ncbi:MAG: tRNA (uridine(34)/cytosine(34)/5-carboxymethylaminomethyluridine(34)-2'-O)-methyltransferase TrmL [Eubacteriales bacterium]|nr:tRNA (uridine(34)/cytosine(34)/5-carboxymethylaminomethyluridine(34)-2'-O)-methyltransferase TrmL [Eubacteriales bacterium]MDD4389200.1 tRNA (uridine(34)/cytosine(34)/5-carboxymethylaminomethyluridine(34)-2'-O)-methyltransferase TrmL [Eubacteriales bacterium]
MKGEKMSIHIVLVEPEIPPNTGNIARSCAATGSVLHLVKPLGFSIDDKSLKRAGLDYWPFVKLEVHESLEEFFEIYGEAVTNKSMYFATTKGGRLYTDVEFKDGDMILFGRETAGLPKELIEKNKDHTLRIPMIGDVRLRSLNLSNSVNIILFEALRQIGFPKLE